MHRLIHGQRLPGLEWHRNASLAPLHSKSSPGGLFLFYRVKTAVKGCQVPSGLKDIPENDFQGTFKVRKCRWQTCVEAPDSYFEELLLFVSTSSMQIWFFSFCINSVYFFKNFNVFIFLVIYTHTHPKK